VAQRKRAKILWLTCGAAVALGCEALSGVNDLQVVAGTGGKPTASGTGGSLASSGGDSTATDTGGATTGGRATGGKATGGIASGGVSPASGGVPNTGGSPASGGVGTGASPASGGVPATGGRTTTGGIGVVSGGTTGTGGAGGANPGPAYYSNPPFAGYAWTATAGTGTTINPANFDSNSPPGAPFCATGSVAPMSDYSGLAMIGINVNQAVGTAPALEWMPSPSHTGLVVNVKNNNGVPLRVQIQSADGATNANHRWCAALTKFDQDVTINWSAFATSCWDGSGNSYDPALGIAAVVVLVPGGTSTPVPYDFCINRVAVAVGGDGGTGGAGGAGGGSATGGSPANGIATPGSYYATSTAHGNVWTAQDTDGSTIRIPNPDMLCATGTAIKIPVSDAGVADYGGAWGVDLGWNLNQDRLADGASSAQTPANLSGLTKMTIGLSRATGLNLRVQFQVQDADSGGSSYYCANVPATGGTIPLTGMTLNCWTSGGAAFDPSIMQPLTVALQVVTDTTQAYPFDFCVTDWSFQ
jgi:hypothetical protein